MAAARGLRPGERARHALAAARLWSMIISCAAGAVAAVALIATGIFFIVQMGPLAMLIILGTALLAASYAACWAFTDRTREKGGRP